MDPRYMAPEGSMVFVGGGKSEIRFRAEGRILSYHTGSFRSRFRRQFRNIQNTLQFHSSPYPVLPLYNPV